MEMNPYSSEFLITVDNEYGQTIGQTSATYEPPAAWMANWMENQDMSDPTFVGTRVTITYVSYDPGGAVVGSTPVVGYWMPP